MKASPGITRITVRVTLYGVEGEPLHCFLFREFAGCVGMKSEIVGEEVEMSDLKCHYFDREERFEIKFV